MSFILGVIITLSVILFWEIYNMWLDNKIEEKILEAKLK